MSRLLKIEIDAPSIRVTPAEPAAHPLGDAHPPAAAAAQAHPRLSIIHGGLADASTTASSSSRGIPSGHGTAPEGDAGDYIEAPGAAFGHTRTRRRRPDPLTGTVNVLPDAAGRLGALSYLVPDHLTVRMGDAVRIPYGKRETVGMVTGPGDPKKATRPILEVFGVRADPSDIRLAHTIAKWHFVDPNTVLPRLAPTSGRGGQARDAGPVELSEAARRLRVPKDVADCPRALLVRAPHTDPAALAAHQAGQLARRGQVLILCPTAALVSEVLAHLPSGAVRLDSKAPVGAWRGFCEGTALIGVGTRTAALYAADNLAGIIVVDEDHPGHLEQRQPATHARDLASARARALRVPLRLISTCPTPQGFGAAVGVYTVGLRSHWPRMVLMDRGQLDPHERLLPGRIRTALTQAVEAGHKPVVLAASNKATRRCVRCNTTRACIACDSSLCTHPEPTPCPTCGGTDGVRMRGWDKQRLAGLFQTSAKVVTLAELAETRNAGVVVIFDVDSLVNAAELIPTRLVASVTMSAAQATGPGGVVFALGGDLRQPVLRDLFSAKDMIAVTRRAYATARAAGLPPHGRLVTIRVQRVHAPKVAGWPGQIHGPKKIADGEWEILIRATNDELTELAPHVLRLRRGGKAKIRVE